MKVEFWGEGRSERRLEIVEIDDSEVEGMTKEQREQYIADQWEMWFWERFNGGYEEVKS